jgi:putative CocE/NonD family hydrolase
MRTRSSSLTTLLWQLAAALLMAVGSVGIVIAATSDAPQGKSLAEVGLGQYRIGEPYRYREAVRRSVYVPMRDGVKLAVDYYLPSSGTRAAKGRFPVVLEDTRYGRARPLPNGGTVRWQEAPADSHGFLRIPDNPSGVLLLLAYGYAVVVVDMRGAGASFGPSSAEGDSVEGRDGFDVVNWIASQRWSDGTVGMLGSSYLAEIQPRVAAERPRALKALSMMRAFFDGENGGYAMGGIYRAGWLGAWSSSVAVSDNRATSQHEPITNIAAVDADPQQSELRLAIAEHREGGDAAEAMSSRLAEFATVGVLRDKIRFIDEYQPSGQNNLSTIVGRVNDSGVPALLFGGWHDLYTNDMLYWYANLTVPKKLIFGPYAHISLGPMPNDPRDRDFKAIVSRETLRWFDRWLLGIKNGAEDRAAVHYGLQRSRERTEWFTATDWPPEQAAYVPLHLSARTAGAVLSQNDGSLALKADEQVSRQPWTVDYTTSLGNSGTRWQMRKVMEIDMAPNDMKSMTFTSPPLERDLWVAGVPVVRLLLSSENAKDADVYAYLTAVTEDGTSRLVSEGILRASHRTLGKAPYGNFGLPFPTSNSVDVANTAPLSATAAPLEFAMFAVGRVFHAGERLRLTISGADRGNTVTVEQRPAPRLGIHVGGESRSELRLPILGAVPAGVFE